jgi:predicted DsbA family dithiol-disulfide isomerase
MSECPYGILGENAMKDVLDNFKGDIDFEIHYIATETSPGVFQSLHGPTEVAENINQLCIAKYNKEKLMEYVLCRNENIKGDWKPCATTAGIDTAKIETCANGAEGKTLLSNDIKIAQGLGISASPTWLANNKAIFNGIDAETIKSNYCSVNSELDGCENTLSSGSADANGATPACG